MQPILLIRHIVQRFEIHFLYKIDNTSLMTTQNLTVKEILEKKYVEK